MKSKKNIFGYIMAFILGVAISVIAIRKYILNIIKHKDDQFYKYYGLYNTIERWFTFKEEGRTIEESLKKRGYQSIAIYGWGVLGKHLYKELIGSKIDVKCVIDRRANELNDSIEILSVDNNFPPVDAIIVTPIDDFNNIKDLLYDRVDCEILSLIDIMV